jgi:hypothetical protein
VVDGRKFERNELVIVDVSMHNALAGRQRIVGQQCQWKSNGGSEIESKNNNRNLKPCLLVGDKKQLKSLVILVT